MARDQAKLEGRHSVLQSALVLQHLGPPCLLEGMLRPPAQVTMKAQAIQDLQSAACQHLCPGVPCSGVHSMLL